MQNLRILVCTETCIDDPQPQLRPIIIGPDPVPVKDPRPGWQATQEGTTPTFDLVELIDGDILPPAPVQPGLYNDGGVLALLPSASVGWPTSDPGVPGALWSNGLVVTASLPVTPNASLVPIYWNQITSVTLLADGADILPTTAPAAGSGQLWVNVAMGGEVWIA